jgi:NhaA family Na+:H+ antiporter
VPALIFLAFTHGQPELTRGWAIPAATDIAFTLGVLALLGSRVPIALKILVMAIAVIDDLGAIIIIALFYTGNLYIPALYVAAAALAMLIAMNRFGAGRPALFVLVGFVLWVALLKSGVHATLAGVLTALCVPMAHPRRPDYRPCEHLLHTLHPWVAFMIMPVFAFANAGVSLEGMTFANLGDPVTLGIILGLFIGKQVGIFLCLFLAIKAKISPMPHGATWLQVYGVSILCGIGFTMSLFIGGLAFTDPTLQVEVRLGVMLGSLLSALYGYTILRWAAARHHA